MSAGDLDVNAVRAGVAAEVDRLSAARAALATDASPSIDELEQRIAVLCRAAEALPRQDAQALAADFERLQAALDELAASLWSAMRRSKGERIFPFQLGRP